jgi:hypothetical protein
MAAMMRTASLIAVFAGLFALRPASAETIVCTAKDPHREVTFDLDHQSRTVSTEVPVNWVWFGRDFVMFLHSVQAFGRVYATQSYTFEETANSLELCDYGTDGPQACGVLTCLRRATDRHHAAGGEGERRHGNPLANRLFPSDVPN